MAVFYGGFFGEGICDLGIPDEQQGLGQLVSQAGRKVGVPESVSGGLQLGGQYPSPVDDQSLTHFTVKDFQGESRDTGGDRSSQFGCQNRSEVFVPNRPGRGAVDRPFDLLVLQREQDDLNQIVQIYPAHPLLTVRNLSP